MKWIVGVDEAGRGPLAGPLTISVFAASKSLRSKLIKILGGQIKDSKQFSPPKRYSIYREFLKLRKIRKILFGVSHVSNKVIDEKGISPATSRAIYRALANIRRLAFNKTKVNKKSEIRLDGSLKAPEEYINQKTIIGGDSKDIFIACASIVSKVRRDRLMRRLAKKYPRYHFEIHKGYGTVLHCKLLKKFGFSSLHRKSFCKNFKM